MAKDLILQENNGQILSQRSKITRNSYDQVENLNMKILSILSHLAIQPEKWLKMAEDLILQENNGQIRSQGLKIHRNDYDQVENLDMKIF